MVGAARLECAEPAAEAREFIRRQLGNSFGDVFDFHVVKYSSFLTWADLRQMVPIPLSGRGCRFEVGYFPAFTNSRISRVNRSSPLLIAYTSDM